METFKLWLGRMLVISLLACAVCWLWWTPSTGKGGLFLAFGAALMPLFYEKLDKVFKSLLLGAFFLLLVVEYRAIDKDRRDFLDDQINARAEEKKQFQALLDEQKGGVKDILQQQKDDVTSILNQEQEHFRTMFTGFVGVQREQQKDFTSLLRQGQAMFARQQELAESLTERLTPSDKPTPANSCGDLRPDDLMIFLGDTAHVTDGFPHTILRVGGVNIVSIDRTPQKEIVVIADIRGNDGKIVARLNENGIVVNKNRILQVKQGSDRHSLIIEDDYGDEVLNAEYLNPHAFKIDALTYAFTKTDKGRQLQPFQLATVTNNPRLQLGCLVTRGAVITDVDIP
jgi:hypothetical protein